MDLREQDKIQNIMRHPWELARKDFIFKLIAKFQSENSVFVDIGCGDLFFLLEVAKKYQNAKFYAVDTFLSNSQIENLNETHSSKNIFVFNSLQKLTETLKNKASVVFMLDVMEHVPDDKAFLNEIINQPFFDAKTLLILTVPAFQSLFNSHDIFLGHYRRYSNNELENTTKFNKLKTLQKGYFFFLLVIIRFFQKKMEKNSEKVAQEKVLIEWNKGERLTKVVKAILVLDYSISWFLRKIGIKLPGLSNYIICKKS